MPSGPIIFMLGQQPPLTPTSASAVEPQPTATKHHTPEQRFAVWAVWSGAMVLGVILVIGIALVVLDRHRRQLMRAADHKKKSRPVTDAWAESGKRLDPETVGSRDDTVDIDPDELGPRDIGGDGGHDPHGEGPHG